MQREIVIRKEIFDIFNAEDLSLPVLHSTEQNFLIKTIRFLQILEIPQLHTKSKCYQYQVGYTFQQPIL